MLQSTRLWILREQKKGLGMFLSAVALAWDLGGPGLIPSTDRGERGNVLGVAGRAVVAGS